MPSILLCRHLSICRHLGRTLGHPLRGVGLLVGLSLATAGHAGPFISEVYLPAWGGTGVEISGVGATGATLAVVNASPGREFRVSATYFVPGVSPEQAHRSTVTVADPDWADALPITASPAATVDAPNALFASDAPTALVLIEGQSALPTGVRLGSGAVPVGIDDDTPIVDWVGFAPADSAAGAAAALETLSPQAIATLNIAGLQRPAAGTHDVSVLARAILEDGPVLDTLFTAGGQWIDASGGGWTDFLVSPGQANPIALPLTAPEPHAVWAVLLLLGAARRPGGRCRFRGG